MVRIRRVAIADGAGMGRTKRTVRVTLLFGSLAFSMASLPALLGKLDATRTATAGGVSAEGGLEGMMNTDALQGLVPDMALINGEQGGYDARELLEQNERLRDARRGSTPRRGVTRVLGPDD